MRKVRFNKFIKAEIEINPKGGDFKIKPGTDCFQEGFENIGMFHCWAEETQPFNNNGLVDFKKVTVAIVEDKDGFVHQVLTKHLKFADNEPTITKVDEAKEFGLSLYRTHIEGEMNK